MIVDNFEQIKQLLTFESEDEFYHLQILKRKKDCPEHERGQNNNARCIKTYYIKSVEYLESKKAEIIGLCKMFNARAYINLNAKSFIKTSFELNVQLADRMKFKQYDHMYRLYETVVGGSEVNVGEKRWIIDVDDKDLSLLKSTVIEINKCQSSQKPRDTFQFDNAIDIIPTKSGWHIITHPFNLKQIEPFKALHPFDIQKNNPTVLYYNDGESCDV